MAATKESIDILLFENNIKHQLQHRIIFEYDAISEDCMSVFKVSHANQPEKTLFEVLLESQYGRRKKGWTLFANDTLFETSLYDCFFRRFYPWYLQESITQEKNPIPEVIIWSISVNHRNNEELSGKPKYWTTYHLRICYLYGNRQIIVCIDDMDQVNYDQNIFTECKSKIFSILSDIGYDPKNIAIIPISSMKNDNIKQVSSKMSWYKGYDIKPIENGSKIVHCHTSCDALDNVIKQDKSEQVEDEHEPFLMSVDDICKWGVKVLIITGKIAQYVNKEGTKIKCSPSRCVKEIKNLHLQTYPCKFVKMAKAGDRISIDIGGIQDSKQTLALPAKGDFITIYEDDPGSCSYALSNPRCKRFVALITIEKDYGGKLRMNEWITKIVASYEKNKLCRMVYIN